VAALELFRDTRVGLVAGPTVPLLGKSLRHDAGAIVSESRFGVGGARVRTHVGALKEISDFPARNLFVRRDELGAALGRGLSSPDALCGSVSSSSDRAVVISPDVIALAPGRALFAPYLRELWRTGLDRGRRLGNGHRVHLHHIVPILLVLSLAGAIPALITGGAMRIAALAFIGVYLLSVMGYAAVIAVLHRRMPLGALAAVGAACAHITFGTAVLHGLLSRLGPRTGRSTGSEQPRPSGLGD
jgi:hypothetical protein